SGNSKNVTTGSLTTSASGDLVFGFLSDDNNSKLNTITYNPTYTKRELASGVNGFCNGGSDCILGEDLIAPSILTTVATATLSTADKWAGSAVAIKAGTFSSGGGGALGSGTSTQYVGQSINVGTTTYYRYFNISDVYRDSNGNVTTTTSGTSYDPSTKQITVIVNIASSTLPQTSYIFYLTRNVNNALNQTNWAGGTAT